MKPLDELKLTIQLKQSKALETLQAYKTLQEEIKTIAQDICKQAVREMILNNQTVEVLVPFDEFAHIGFSQSFNKELANQLLQKMAVSNILNGK